MKTNSRITVLLVDDDEVDRESISRAIGSDCELIDAEEGYVGLQMAKEYRPDCILLDYRLPDINGLDLLPQFIAEDIPIIMLTGAGTECVAVDAMKIGASDYIPKTAISPLQLREAIRRAVRSAAMQRKIAEQQGELESFVSIASHDLRTPLRHIVNFAEFARDESQGDVTPEVEGYLNNVVEAGNRMEELLSSLVEFARSGRSETELLPVELDVVVQHAVTNLSVETNQSNAQIDVQGLPSVLGHEPSLIELMQNLLANAMKYASDKTPLIRISAIEHGNSCTVSVSDNGIGIPSDSHERIFQPFRRLHSYSEVKGSGIGLASCKRIVAHHQGRIWVESTPSSGSTFSFTLQLPERSNSNAEVGSMESHCSAPC